MSPVALSTDDILDGAIGVRAEGFVFDLCDSARNSMGQLNVSLDNPPTISVDTSRSLIRKCDGLSITAADLSGIDVRADRVRPWMVLPNGARLPLGVFVFGTDNRAPTSGSETWTPDLFDESFLVAQALRKPAGLAPGGSVLTFLQALVDTVGLFDVDLTGINDAPASVAIAKKTGDDRKAAVDAAAKLLGCYPMFFDNNGTYRIRSAPTAGTPADHVYGTGTRVILGSLRTSNSGYTAANLYQVVSSNGDTAIVGTYELPPDAPNSKENRNGEVIVDSKNMPGLFTQENADAAAYINYLTDQNSYTKASFATPTDPRHGVFDIVELYGVRYQETGWSITCAAGAEMRHDLTGMFE